MMTSNLGSLSYKSWKLTKIMPNSLKFLNHYILSNAPQKIRQWALKEQQKTSKSEITSFVDDNFYERATTYLIAKDKKNSDEIEKIREKIRGTDHQEKKVNGEFEQPNHYL